MKDDFIEVVERLEQSVMDKYLNIQKPHFWGGLVFFWSVVIASIWLVTALHR